MQSRYRFLLHSALMTCCCLTAVSCSGQAPTSSTEAGGSTPQSKSSQPVPARLVNGTPQGLYYMQKMWIATRFLEKSCWYFAPDGKVFENPTSGFSREDLAKHKGRTGTYKVSGGKLEVRWSDGELESGEIEIEQGGGFIGTPAASCPLNHSPLESPLPAITKVAHRSVAAANPSSCPSHCD